VTDGPELVYFARRSERRKLLNEQTVACVLEDAGFARIFPEDHGIVEQITFVRNARCIVASDGSAATLAFFAQPGTKLCILASERMFFHAAYTNSLQELGIDVTILTGPPHGSAMYVHHNDYAIPEDLLRTFLGEWID
jgi:capsular polysaccharide biosynthesis protein